LRGGAVRGSGVFIDCAAPKRVLIRIRATVRGSTALRDRAHIFLATNAAATQAKLAVRTAAGKPVAYADVADSGTTRIFTAKGCTSE
jgi:hypothetical protein